jgi:hypothetical protein
MSKEDATNLANDLAAETAQATPSKELDVWWPEVKKSVDSAEQHLGVPAGTISSIPDDPDFIATVKTYAVIEPILNDLIAAYPPHRTIWVISAGFLSGFCTRQR